MERIMEMVMEMVGDSMEIGDQTEIGGTDSCPLTSPPLECCILEALTFWKQMDWKAKLQICCRAPWWF